VPNAPESWGTIPLGDLIALLEVTTGRLSKQYEEVALDQGAYHRKYWSHWQQLPEDMSVAAMNRDCELVCKELQETVILGTSILEGLKAKRDALIAVLASRST
jgi:hypothetical protein